MSSELVAEVITRLDQLPEIEADWRRLWAAQVRPEIFTSFDWSMAAMECRTDGARPHVAVVRRSSVVVGLLPLLVDRNGLGFLSGARADYNDILVDDADAAAVIEAALRCAMGPQGPGRGRLAEVPEWSQLARTINGLPAGLRSRLLVYDESTCPALRLGRDRDALLKEMTGKKSLKRHEKKLEKFGAISLRHIEDRAEVLQFLDDFFAQHVTRRVVAGDRSLFLDDEPRRFYKALVMRLDPAKELRFAVLEAGGRAVAYHYGFEVAGRFTWYKPTFDVDFLDTGVGEVLLKRLLDYLKERPVHEFDFTRGNESFKDRFSNHRGQNVQLFVHTTASRTRVAGWWWAVKAQAKQTPWLARLHARLKKRSIAPAAGRPQATKTPTRAVYRRDLDTSTRQAHIDDSSDARNVAQLSLRKLAEMSAMEPSPAAAARLRGMVERVVNGATCFGVRQGDTLRGFALVYIDPVGVSAPRSGAQPAAPQAAESPRVEFIPAAASTLTAADLQAVLDTLLGHYRLESIGLDVDPADHATSSAARQIGGVTSEVR